MIRPSPPHLRLVAPEVHDPCDDEEPGPRLDTRGTVLGKRGLKYFEGPHRRRSWTWRAPSPDHGWLWVLAAGAAIAVVAAIYRR